VDKPGLFFWLQDTGGGGFHQKIAVISDERPFGATWQASQPAAGSPFPLPLKANGSQPSVLAFKAENKNYLDIGPLLIDYSQGFTVEAWVKYNSSNSSARIIEFFDPIRQHYIVLDHEHFWVSLHGSGSRAFVIVSDSLKLNSWLYVVVTIDAQGKAVLYLNGTEQAKGDFFFPPSGLWLNNYIGRSNFSESSYLDGEIAMLRLWNMPLKAETVKAYYQKPLLALPKTNPTYQRRLVQLPGKPYLMRGDVYGNQAAEPLFPLAIEGGLALASQSEASHEQRISAYRQRLAAQEEAQAKLLQARAEAHALVQQSHQENEANHAQAQQAVNDAQADANRRRAAAQQKRQAAPEQANQIRSNAQQTAEQHKAQAKQQADTIKQRAQDQKQQIVNDANSDLAAAKAEKAKYKS
jgi:hypothetical protein